MKNSYNLIAKFNYEGKNYSIVLMNNNKIVFICYENDKLKIDLSKEEYSIVNTVYDSLLINELYSIELGIKNINGKLYRIFYDWDSKNYYWKLQNKHDKPNKQDNIILNFRYNNNPIVLYNSDDNHMYQESDKKSRFYTKLVNIGKKIAIVFVASGVALTAVKGCSIVNPTLYQEVKNSITEFAGIDREYNFEDIRDAIENNPNLTDTEKDFLYKFRFVFDENNQYMNLNRTIDRLSNLKVTYVNSICPYDDTTLGTYKIIDNNITIYQAKDFETSDIRIFTHEFYHVLQDISSRFTEELSNELFTRETLRKMCDLGLIEDDSIFKDEFGVCTKFGTGYEDYMYLYYRLADMMSEEDLRKYQFSCDENIIISSLLEIDKKSNQGLEGNVEAYKLLESMDELRYYNNENDSYEFSNSEDAYKDCCNYLDNYYKKLNGIDPKEDLNVAILYGAFGSQGLKSYEVICKAVEKTIMDNGKYPSGVYCKWEALPKTYLYSDYPNPLIFYQTSPIQTDKSHELEVSDELQENYKENYKKIREVEDIINAKEDFIEYE